MFPYPSAQGLHVGHPLGYIGTDIVTRKFRMQGFRVLHPMGFDAFGLPAENYAIKTQTHPSITTAAAMENYRKQLRVLGLSYDWSREVNTSSPEYYRWTQWMFLQLYKMGLAYRKQAPVNWCETDHTVLANEQVVDGKCERCKNPVVQKFLRQWFFKITAYADRLLADLTKVKWPERILLAQKHWIGKSEGASIVFMGAKGEEVEVFTTRPDTVMGVSYVVLAPEHKLIEAFTTAEQKSHVDAYRASAAKKSELERGMTDKEKTGVASGGFVTHPITGKQIPVWVGDYVIGSYGTGAVMGVPAHDERDFAFAKSYGLPIIEVVRGEEALTDSAFTGDGVLVNSGAFDGLKSEDAHEKIVAELAKLSRGGKRVTYHLRDWLVSRQRYWGAPIPIIYCDSCGEQPVPEQDLPVRLPEDVDFRPTGESPLTRSESFHNVNCPKCGAKARRESDTMDTFVDSSWYFLRYVDPKNTEKFADPKKLAAWCPVDLYVGGVEHATSHLLFARFFTKVLFDAKHLGFDEPFMELRNQGLIQGSDGQKMSKSRGNVVNPDEVVAEFGADTMRAYEMFMGPFEDSKPWDTKGMVGVNRFLEKVWRLGEATGDAEESDAVRTLRHATIKKVGADIENFNFNTCISALMIFSNELTSLPVVPKQTMKSFLQLLTPFAPHIAEEIWEKLGFEGSASTSGWPAYEEKYLKSASVKIAVQVNGKVRGTVDIKSGASQEEVFAAANADASISAHVTGKEIVKVIHVPDRLLSIVVK
jgi:leucyl-tRNA synthetase